jgi:hypothetical protein
MKFFEIISFLANFAGSSLEKKDVDKFYKIYQLDVPLKKSSLEFS